MSPLPTVDRAPTTPETSGLAAQVEPSTAVRLPEAARIAQAEAACLAGNSSGAKAFDWRALVEPDFWASVPSDVPELLRLLDNADLYVQDEIDVRHLPTLTRVWSRKGRRGQRLVRAPGRNTRFVAFGAVDWRDGWHSVGFGLKRTAELFCLQLDHLVERSQSRGRIAMVLVDNAKIHTREGAKLVGETLDKHGDKLRLVYTPAYDPESNPTERLWPPLRRSVTHNHHRDDSVDLYHDTEGYFARLDLDPNLALQHIGSPFATTQPNKRPQAVPTQS